MEDNQSYEIGFHLGENDSLLRKTFEWGEYYKYDFSWENDLSSLLKYSDRVKNTKKTLF